MREEKSQEAERNIKMQEIAIDKINELGKKLKTTVSKSHKHESKSGSKEAQKRLLQPQ